MSEMLLIAVGIAIGAAIMGLGPRALDAWRRRRPTRLTKKDLDRQAVIEWERDFQGLLRRTGSPAWGVLPKPPPGGTYGYFAISSNSGFGFPDDRS